MTDEILIEFICKNDKVYAAVDDVITWLSVSETTRLYLVPPLLKAKAGMLQLALRDKLSGTSPQPQNNTTTHETRTNNQNL